MILLVSIQANDCTDSNETISFRIGAAIRDNCTTRFLRSCYLPELVELARVAPAVRPMLTEAQGRALVFGLGARVEAFDAAADKRDGRTKAARKFRALANAAEAAQIAWGAANMATLRSLRVAA